MELQRVIAALRRSAGLLAIAALSAFLVAAAISAVRPAVYEAHALVDVAQLIDDDDAFSSAERADRTVANDLVLAEDQQVAARASERLGGVDVGELQDDVSIEQLTGTDNIQFTAGARGPRAAARIATAYAEAYAAARLEQREAVVRAQAEEVSRQLAELQRQLDALTGVLSPQDQSREQALREQYSQRVGREVELRTGPDADPGLAVLPATVPQGPAGVGPLQWGVLAAVLTLALGGLVVAARSRSRDAVEFRSDLQDLGLPVLAEATPATRLWRSRVDQPADAALFDEAVLGLTLAGTVPAAVAVVSVDGLDHGDFVRELGGRLDERGVHVVRADRSATGSRRPTSTSRQMMTLLDATAQVNDTERLRSELADVVLVVVVRGITRRADLSRTVEQLERVSASPRLAVLLDADRRRQRGGARCSPSPGASASADGGPVIVKSVPHDGVRTSGW